MASISDKIAPPNYAAFQPNGLEQIYAQELPRMGGLAAMFLNAAQDERRAGSAAYQTGVTQANKMAFALDQLEAQQKYRTEVLKQTGDLAGKGFLPGNMNLSGDIFSNIAGGDATAQTINNLRIAQAGAESAKASDSGGVKTVMTSDSYPGMSEGPIRTQVTGKNAELVAAELMRRRAAANGVINKPGAAAPIPPSIQQMQQRLDRVGQ